MTSYAIKCIYTQRYLHCKNHNIKIKNQLIDLSCSLSSSFLFTYSTESRASGQLRLLDTLVPLLSSIAVPLASLQPNDSYEEATEEGSDRLRFSSVLSLNTEGI